MTSDNELAILESLGEVIEQRKLLEVKEKELKAALGTLFENTPDGTIAAGDFAVTVKHNTGRRTLDKAALVADGIDVDSYYKVGKPFITVSSKRMQNA